jgi:hypothetical protein
MEVLNMKNEQLSLEQQRDMLLKFVTESAEYDMTGQPYNEAAELADKVRSANVMLSCDPCIP